MKRYNLSKIMTKAWALFRKGGISFSEALHRSWLSAKAEPVNAARIEAAKAGAGITEETNTWAGWKAGIRGHPRKQGPVRLRSDPRQQGRRSDLQGQLLRLLPGPGRSVKEVDTMLTQQRKPMEPYKGLTMNDLSPDGQEFVRLFRAVDAEAQELVTREVILLSVFGDPFFKEIKEPAEAWDRQAMREIIERWEAKLQEEGAVPQ